MLKKSEIKQIKKWLPRGFIKTISDNTGFSESYVEKFFSGAKYNASIHTAAVELANENKTELDSIKTKLIA